MHLLKQIPKDILSYTTFPLLLSITCYLIEAVFNPDATTSHWQVNNFSLEPNKFFVVSLLRNLREAMMNSYHSYFDFMRMMATLHIMCVIIRFSQKYISQKAFPENQESLPIVNHSKKYLNKTLRCLIYLTVSFYICQFTFGTLNSPSFLLVEAKDIPDDFDLDRLPLITKTQGAASGVVSRDGKIIFQIQKIRSGRNSENILLGMDVSDPLEIKYYPESNDKLEGYDTILALSSDSKTLFLANWKYLYIFDISQIRSPPKLVSKSAIPDPDLSYSRPSVALYEKQKVIVLGNRHLHILNIADLKNPIRQSGCQLSEAESANSIAILPYKEIALVGAKDGLRVFDLSDLNKPILKARILEDEFVVSISIKNFEPTAFVGVINRNLTFDQLDEGIVTWNASLSLYLVNLGTKDFLSYSSFLLIDQLKTCEASFFEYNWNLSTDIKMTLDRKYAYWACNQDYGYVDIERQRISRFLAQNKVNALSLAQDSKILLKMDSVETNLLALYQNVQNNQDPLVWKPNSISRLKLSPSAKVFTFKDNRLVFLIDSNSTLQIYNTSENSFSLISTRELNLARLLSVVPSKNGKRVYMKTDEKTIQIYDISTQKFTSIDFMATINDDFIVTPDDKIIYACQKVGQNITIIFADIRNPSSPLVDDLLVEGQKRLFPDSAKLVLQSDGKNLLVLGGGEFIVLSVSTILTNKNAEQKLQESSQNMDFDSAAFSPAETYWISPIYMIVNDKNFKQKIFRAFFPHPNSDSFLAPIPYLAGNLPMEVSSDGKLVYLSTPEYLIEISKNLKNYDPPKTSRLMKLTLKQFSLTGDDKFMYAIIGDYLEILDMRSKYVLTSWKEDFPLGASEKVVLQLLERAGESKWDPVYKNHKFLTANFFKPSNLSSGNELVISYSALPNWINFDKDTSEITIESRLLSHLGTSKISTTGSFDLPPSSKLISSLPILGDLKISDQLLSDLTDHGYLDEEGFLTTKFNPYKKLTLNSIFSEFESEIRYFLRDYITDQEFVFEVSPSLFLHQYPSPLSIDTQSPHYTTARIVLPVYNFPKENEIVGQFVKRTYSSARSFLNENQMDLILEGTFLSLNEALAEVIIDLKRPGVEEYVSIFINDNMNPPIKAKIPVAKNFRVNAKPIANSDQNFSVQSQVSKYSFISGQSFSINLHPKTYLDINERPLEYSSLSPELDWLEIRGLTLTGTPPKKLWPSKVNVTMKISNEFKSEKITFTLEIGMSAVILLQYVILYFGYLFSGYKMYQNLPKFYSILAQKFYRYPKMYQVYVKQEVTDATIAPIGFFGKEFANADLLIKYIKKYLAKNPKDFIDHFKKEEGHELDKNKLIATINQVLESLKFEERYSVKYYVQVDDDQREIIHQIILDKIILAQLNLSSEKPTLNLFKKIRNQWIDIVEQEDPSQPYFKVNKLKLSYALQNIDSKMKDKKPLEAKNPDGEEKFLDITQGSVRSRYFSNNHLFEKSSNDIEETLLDSTQNIELENVNMELLELALKAHAFKSHHLNAHREQVTILSKTRKVGFSCLYKIKALLRRHLQGLQFANREDLGYGLKYVFKKDVMHFCGKPEPRMEYETLVVQFLNGKGLIMREIYIFGAENNNRKKGKIEQVQEQL